MKIESLRQLSTGEKNIILGIIYLIGFGVMWVSSAPGGVIAAVWLALWSIFIFTSGIKFAVVEMIWWLACLLDILFPISTSTDSFSFFLEIILLGPCNAFGNGRFQDFIYPAVCAVMLCVGAAGIIYGVIRKKKCRKILLS